MTDNLKTRCEKSFYSELYHFEETSQGLLIDNTTGRIYLKKILETYDINVYEWLKGHSDPHIPRVHSFWEEDGRLVVLEEYIQGETLEVMLAKENPTEQERLRIILSICDALSFLHSAPKPIIHRDVKASNIMLTSDRIVKLIDYDAAKTFHAGKKSDTTLIGTHGSAAPEQYGFAQSDARTDIYSLGVLIGEMLPRDKKYAHIIAKATQMDPSSRYQSIYEMKQALLELSDHNKKERSSRILLPVFICTAASFICLILCAIMLFHQTNDRNSGKASSEEAAAKTDSAASASDVSTELKIDASETDTAPAPEAPSKAVTASESKPAASAATSDTAHEAPVIEESCWYLSTSEYYPEGYIHYGAIISNPNDSYAISFPTIYVTAKDKKGNILGTDTMVGSTILPNDHILLSSLLSISDYDGSDINTEFSVAPSEYVPAAGLSVPGTYDFKISNVSEHNTGLFPNVTGEITSGFSEKISSAALIAVFRKKGKPVAMETAYIDDLLPDTATPFQIDFSTNLPKHDSVEVYAQDW